MLGKDWVIVEVTDHEVEGVVVQVAVDEVEYVMHLLVENHQSVWGFL